MELVLVSVSIVSFVIATGMSLIAWKLLRDEDGRSAARAALLQESVERLNTAERGAGAGDTPALDADIFDVFASEPAAAMVAASAPASAPAFESAPASASASASASAPASPPASADFDEFDPWDFKKESGTSGRPARRAPALPLRPLRPARLNVDVPAAAMLFQTAPGLSPSLRRGAAISVVVIALLMVTGVASVYAIRNGGLAALANRTTAAAGTATSQGRPLELISLQHERGPDGAFTVSGIIQNPSESRTAAGVGAVVHLYDASGQLVGTGRASIARTTLPAGEASTFVVRVPGAPDVSRYRVGFRTPDDATVPHVDRRQDPSDASGELQPGRDGRATDSTAFPDSSVSTWLLRRTDA